MNYYYGGTSFQYDRVLHIDSASRINDQNGAITQTLKRIETLNDEYYSHYQNNSQKIVHENHLLDSISLTCTSTSQTIRICVISDTHEEHRCITHLIPQCDILIHTGDIFMTNRMMSIDGSMIKLREFNNWLSQLPAKNVVVIGGNHDKILETLGEEEVQKMLPNANYLMNSSICINGLNIFGTPASEKGNALNQAFQSSKFLKKTAKILRQFNESNRVDLLLTHGRCEELSLIACPLIAHCWGHVHSWHGVSRVTVGSSSWLSINSTIMDNYDVPNQVPMVFDVKI